MLLSGATLPEPKSLLEEIGQELITTRGLQILIISFTAMFLCQFLKFAISSIRTKSAEWYLLCSTGGFPSSHTGFVVSLCICLGMFQWHDLGGKLDWSFPVAVVLSTIVIHDAMGVRLEASKHAKILNNMAKEAALSEEERKELGFGKKGELKEMLGHKGREVLGGAVIGTLIGLIGFFIFREIY